jgi:hypothetical protein
MRHITLILAALALAVAAPAIADKGGNPNGGNGNGNGDSSGGGQGSGGTGSALETTISLDGGVTARTESGVVVVSGDVTFSVTRSYPYDKDTIWVTNTCYDETGSVVLDRDAAVMWGTWESLVGTTGAMPTAGAACVAYVTLRPWHDQVHGDSVVEYAVA